MKRRVLVVVAVWLCIAVAWAWYRNNSGLGTVDAAQELVDRSSGSWWAVGAFLTVSVLRPFVFFPATLLTVAAGLLFGPFFGVLVAATGANASAMVGHTIGSAFVGDVERDGRITAWRARMTANGFESVLLMRLVFLPYDLVNYASGYLGVRRSQFLTATAIGSLPGTVSFVLLGASVGSLTGESLSINRWALVASITLILASLLVSRGLRRRSPP